MRFRKEGEVRLSVSFLRKNFVLLSIVPIARTAGICLSVIRMRGLFTLNTFLRHTELFDTYLAVDPSLWWDQGRLVREAEALVAGRNFKGKSLYIGVASKKKDGPSGHSS